MGKVGRESPMDMAQYGEIVKTATRPNYTALMASYAKNPEAAAATKKVMLAFIAVLNNATDSIGLKNNLQTALAELELVAP